MPHLRRYPLGRFSRHQHHRSVGVAHLVWVAVTDLGLLQNSCPHPFAGHQVSGPPFACAGVLKDLFPLQIGVRFMVLQSDQRRGQKLYVSDAGIGLGCFGFLGGLSQRLVDPDRVLEPIDNVPIKGAKLGNSHARPESELNQVAFLACGSRIHNIRRKLRPGYLIYQYPLP